jgi:hypothetical protein
MSIKVTNSASQEIKVAINIWGTDGSTDYFRLKVGSHDTWDRTDERGFVMVVRKTASQLPYYVQPNSDIIVLDDKVTDRGSTIKPIG